MLIAKKNIKTIQVLSPSLGTSQKPRHPDISLARVLLVEGGIEVRAQYSAVLVGQSLKFASAHRGLMS